MTRVFESNGPDIKIRGTASHVAEKYVQLARDARSSGDPVAAENYYQHAEHYFRLIAAAQEQLRQNQPQQQPRLDNDVSSEDGDDEENYSNFGQEPGFVPQPYMRDNGQQPFQREQQQPREQRERDHRPPQQYQPQPPNQPQPVVADSGNVDRLPSFITGGAPPPANGGYEANGGAERPERSNERFPRRRRRPHGPRPDNAAAPAPSEDVGNE